MANGIVNLVFRSIAQGNGFKDTLAQAREMKGEMGDLSGAMKKLGGVAGQTGGLVGEMLSSALKGGVWGAVAAAVGVIVQLYGKWRDAAKETAEEEKKAFDERIKAADDYRQAVEKSYKSSVSAIDENLKRINQEVDATRELQEAELELARERARARGDTEEVERLDRKKRVIDASASEEKMLASLKAAKQSRDEAKRFSEDIEDAFGATEANYARAVEAYTSAVGKVRAAAENEVASASDNNDDMNPFLMGATSDEIEEAGNRAVKDYLDTDEAKGLADMMEKAKVARDAAKVSMVDAQKALAKAEGDLGAMQTKAEAMVLKARASEMKSLNDEADARNAAREAEEKAEEKAAAERAAQIQREHEQRLKLIQEETSARLEQERKVQQQASSRFEQEFAMWLDPEARDRKLEEQEQRRQNIERMKTDVLRTGSSGRVREIAELMRAGDEEGIEAKFSTWRRGGWFSGMDREQEQLIRTAAAYETQDDAKRNIARIAENTEALSDKLDSLLKVK